MIDINVGDVIEFPNNSFGVTNKNMIARLSWEWTSLLLKFPSCSKILFLVVKCDNDIISLLHDSVVYYTKRSIMPTEYYKVCRL